MKKLYILIDILFIVFFPLSVSAQSFGTVKIDVKPFPQKIQTTQPDPLSSGIYTIGSSGDFPTIDSAFSRLSVDGIDGPVILELTDNMYSAPENDFGYLINGPIPGADENNMVTIRPAENTNVTIEGSGGGVLSFLNTSYLTIDGIGLTGNRTLSVHSIYNAQYNHNQPVSFFDNSDHNSVKNINVIDGDNTYQAAPIGLFITNSSSVPDSNLVTNNAISGGSVGVVIVGNDTLVEPTGNIISTNYIGSETDSLKSYGIFIQFCKNTLIEKNIIQNMRLNYPIEQETYGIYEHASRGTIIRDNVIHNLYDATGSYGAMGLVLENGTQTIIYNNMIYDISCSSPGSFLAGILLLQETDPKIYYNSIYLSGSGDSPNGSENLYILSNSLNVELKNNIFVNTRNDTLKPAAAIVDYTDTNITSDNNDLYCASDTINYLVRISTTEYSTLEDWQTMGQDLNSISEMPPFKSPYLHIDWNQPTQLDSGAIPISGITTDIDGDPRNAETPDIGADESIMTTVISQYTQLRNYQLRQNYPNPFNPTTRIQYSLPAALHITIKVFDIIGEEVAVLVNSYKSAGNHEIVFNASDLPSGVYFYRLKAGNYTSVKKMLLLK